MSAPFCEHGYQHTYVPPTAISKSANDNIHFFICQKFQGIVIIIIIIRADEIFMYKSWRDNKFPFGLNW